MNTSTLDVTHPSRGHVTATWNPVDDKSAAEVEEIFDALVAEGMTGVVTDADGTEHTTRTFPREATQVTGIWPLQGG